MVHLCTNQSINNLSGFFTFTFYHIFELFKCYIIRKYLFYMYLSDTLKHKFWRPAKSDSVNDDCWWYQSSEWAALDWWKTDSWAIAILIYPSMVEPSEFFFQLRSAEAKERQLCVLIANDPSNENSSQIQLIWSSTASGLISASHSPIDPIVSDDFHLT
jgi:hypothetical protein